MEKLIKKRQKQKIIVLNREDYETYLDILSRYNKLILTKETMYLKKINIVTMFTLKFVEELNENINKDAFYKFIRSLIETSNYYTMMKVNDYKVIDIGRQELELFIRELKDHLGEAYGTVINDEVVGKYLSDIKLLTLFLVMRHKLLKQ